MTIEEVFKHIVHLLKNLNNSAKDKNTIQVMKIFRDNVFFVNLMENTDLPDEIADTIQDYLEQNLPIEIHTH